MQELFADVGAYYSWDTVNTLELTLTVYTELKEIATMEKLSKNKSFCARVTVPPTLTYPQYTLRPLSNENTLECLSGIQVL